MPNYTIQYFGFAVKMFVRFSQRKKWAPEGLFSGRDRAPATAVSHGHPAAATRRRGHPAAAPAASSAPPGPAAFATSGHFLTATPPPPDGAPPVCPKNRDAGPARRLYW